MGGTLLWLYVRCQVSLSGLRQRATDEHGEGVISTAIAVLIMALLGAAMWVAFKGMFDSAAGRASSAVNELGG